MEKAKGSCVPDAISLAGTSVAETFKEEKYRRILFRTLKRGRDGAVREYLYLEEENRH